MAQIIMDHGVSRCFGTNLAPKLTEACFCLPDLSRTRAKESVASAVTHAAALALFRYLSRDVFPDGLKTSTTFKTIMKERDIFVIKASGAPRIELSLNARYELMINKIAAIAAIRYIIQSFMWLIVPKRKAHSARKTPNVALRSEMSRNTVIFPVRPNMTPAITRASQTKKTS